MTHIQARMAGVLFVLSLAVPGFAADPPAAQQPTSGPAAESSSRPKDAKGERQAPAEKPAEASAPSAPDPAAQPDDPDLDFNPAQPDFVLGALPTTLRLPRNKMTFRLTHRFNEPLDESRLADMFGMDSGALIGLEFRYGVISGGQVGFYRTSDRTIEFFTQYEVAKQGRTLPFGIAAYASIEGTNNFSDKYSPGIGAVISRELGTRAAVYAEPFWVNNSNPEPSDLVDHNSTSFMGFGIRLRVLSSTYLVAEAAPRLAGYSPGTTHVSFGIEQRAGGHLFQLTFANNPGTTLANVSRGGPEGNNWYLGFNLARKFF
jgi:hypothetical protein